MIRSPARLTEKGQLAVYVLSGTCATQKRTESAFFLALEGKDIKDVESNKEQGSPKEIKNFVVPKKHVQHPRFFERSRVFHDRLDSERSETSSGPQTPLCPLSQHVREQVDDSSTSSIASV